jgi:hypothetical protein
MLRRAVQDCLRWRQPPVKQIADLLPWNWKRERQQQIAA